MGAPFFPRVCFSLINPKTIQWVHNYKLCFSINVFICFNPSTLNRILLFGYLRGHELSVSCNIALLKKMNNNFGEIWNSKKLDFTHFTDKTFRHSPIYLTVTFAAFPRTLYWLTSSDQPLLSKTIFPPILIFIRLAAFLLRLHCFLVQFI